MLSQKKADENDQETPAILISWRTNNLGEQDTGFMITPTFEIPGGT